MEDFERQMSNYRYRQPRNFRRSPVIFNPAADVLAGIEYVEGAFKDRRRKVNLFQQQAEQRRIDMQNLVDDTKRIDQTDAMAKMTEQFSNMVTDVYKADIASFDGDRTDYINKSNNAQKVIGDFGKVIGIVDELSNKYTGMNAAEQEKMVLRSQFVGADGDKKKAYMEFLNDPSKMNIRIQGKDIIITNNGEDLFNGTQLINSVKSGGNLIEYADDYTEQIGSASKDAMSGIKNLVVAKQYENMANDGSKLYTTAENDYMTAVNKYKENLENSGKIDALLNESTFQRYTDLTDVYDPAKHNDLTKQKIIDFLVNREFPMYTKGQDGKETATANIKETTKLVKQPSDFEKAQLAYKQRKLGLEELKLGREIEKELAPKFKNQLEQNYSKEETNQFLTARKKYKDIKIAMDQIVGSMDLTPMPSLVGMTQKERNETRDRVREQNSKVLIKEEDLKKLFESYPSIEMPAYEEINTPAKLENVLMTVVLEQDPTMKNFDRDKYNVMNRDYENFLKEQEGITTKGGAAQFNTNQ